jgi:hypothetical protein
MTKTNKVQKAIRHARLRKQACELQLAALGPLAGVTSPEKVKEVKLERVAWKDRMAQLEAQAQA